MLKIRMTPLGTWNSTGLQSITDAWKRCDLDDLSSFSPLATTSVSPDSVSRHQPSSYVSFNTLLGLPTPPRSPSMEPELDELVATIPEILEGSHTITDFCDILNDITTFDPPKTATAYQRSKPVSFTSGGSWASTFQPVNVNDAKAVAENAIKKDIMWGWGGAGGVGSPERSPPPNHSTGMYSPESEPRPSKKLRLISESSSVDSSYNELPQGSFYSEDEDDHMPETPAGSDDDDAKSPMRPGFVTPPYSTRTIRAEHDYCFVSKKMTVKRENIIREEDEDDLDIVYSKGNSAKVKVSAPRTKVSMPKISFVYTSIPANSSITSSNVNYRFKTPNITIHQQPLTPITPGSNVITVKDSSNASPEVKRQLKMAVEESIRNRREGIICESDVITSSFSSAFTCTVAKPKCFEGTIHPYVQTRGKPGAYTQRLRETHNEMMRATTAPVTVKQPSTVTNTSDGKSIKRRRVGRGQENDEGRRSVHNTLERQRRVDIRESFDFLRRLVPETETIEKASKVKILKTSSVFCKQLQAEGDEYERQRELLLQNSLILKQRLKELEESMV